DHGWNPRGRMEHGIVLNVRPRAHLDPADIAPEDRAEPDAGLLPDRDVADHRRGRRDERRRRDAGCAALVGQDQHAWSPPTALRARVFDGRPGSSSTRLPRTAGDGYITIPVVSSRRRAARDRRSLL